MGDLYSVTQAPMLRAVSVLKGEQKNTLKLRSEEFANGGCTLKTHQMFSVHTMPEEFKNATITGHLDLRFTKLAQGNHMMIVTSSFSKSSVFKIFSVHTKTQSRRFQIPPVWRAFSRKALFWWRFVRTVSPTVEIKLRFQIPPHRPVWTRSLKLVKYFGQRWRKVTLAEVKTACFIIYLRVWSYYIFHLRRLMWNSKKAVTRIKISLEEKAFCFSILPSNQVKHWGYQLSVKKKKETFHCAIRNNLAEMSLFKRFHFN